MEKYFQVKVLEDVKGVYSVDGLDSALDKARYYLQDGESVSISLVEMTIDEFLDITDKLIG